MAMKKIFKQDEYREYGFGNRVVEHAGRLMNRDGSSNVRRTGLPFPSNLNIYHSLVTMSWWKFSMLVGISYVVVNLLFASIYYFLDPGNLAGMIYTTPFEKFMEVFFFSAQSLTTVGYGRLNPTGMFSSTVAAIESMIGLLGFAMATGLLYGRFSRPVAKILFSKDILIAPYKGITALMIRVANANRSELIDIEAKIIMSHIEIEGENRTRKFAPLKLELTKVTLLSMSWTIVHPIDEESPVYGWKMEDYNKKDVEFLVLMQAYEETFAQTVHARSSFRYHEMVSGAKFSPMVEANEDGTVLVTLNKLSDYSPASIEIEMQKLA